MHGTSGLCLAALRLISRLVEQSPSGNWRRRRAVLFVDLEEPLQNFALLGESGSPVCQELIARRSEFVIPFVRPHLARTPLGLHKTLILKPSELPVQSAGGWGRRGGKADFGQVGENIIAVAGAILAEKQEKPRNYHAWQAARAGAARHPAATGRPGGLAASSGRRARYRRGHRITLLVIVDALSSTLDRWVLPGV